MATGGSVHTKINYIMIKVVYFLIKNNDYFVLGLRNSLARYLKHIEDEHIFLSLVSEIKLANLKALFVTTHKMGTTR